MWYRKSFLFLVTLWFIIVYSVAFSQSNQPAQKQLLSADTLRARAVEVSRMIQPGTLVPASIDRHRPLSPIPLTLDSPHFSPAAEEQWVSFRFSSTQWEWNVRSPGSYAGKVLAGSIQSNGDVLIDFNGFGDFQGSGGPENSIENYYAIAPPTATIDGLRWMRSDELNAYDIHVSSTSPALGSWALWHRIIVNESTPSSELGDAATVSIKLLSDGAWLDTSPKFTDWQDKSGQ
ncbi:MAG: hypothetical protein GTO24_18920 [candidate division Zixibacteria bacterium]|nr:hypothetical protein [candidate division Zixibacteria bacterium]